MIRRELSRKIGVVVATGATEQRENLMRRAIFVVGAAALVFGVTAGGARAADQPPVARPAWCGFKDKPGSRVRCGYSTEGDCKQGVGEPGAICIVDPYLTENRRAIANG